eukprot:58513-Prymnesium_polylepis.1
MVQSRICLQQQEREQPSLIGSLLSCANARRGEMCPSPTATSASGGGGAPLTAHKAVGVCKAGRHPGGCGRATEAAPSASARRGRPTVQHSIARRGVPTGTVSWTTRMSSKR